MDIIVDIDGTLADNKHREHLAKAKQWDEFFDLCHEDKGISTVVHLVLALRAAGNELFFLTGRPERVRVKTTMWLSTHTGLQTFTLMMRRDGDHRPDHVIKREMLHGLRALGANPVLAIDDRDQVVKMWCEEGLVCAQVAEGDF